MSFGCRAAAAESIFRNEAFTTSKAAAFPPR
jgi:hypothetical protein